MSSFQFPANPSDGDIVVRGDLQAFYNAATNTWRVSQVPTAPGIPGPPGPPGPIGPPGEGIQVSGIVDTFADLPQPNTSQFEFWIVDDSNTVYFSDGMTWSDFGGPIQGPQGKEGEKGEDGTNGQNGRGWYDTSVDESNGEYRVTFLSNDGLTFTTDNLKGPAGEPGEDGNDGQDFTGNIPCASVDTAGVVRIGDGIDIGTDCVATVNLIEAPLNLGTTEPDAPSLTLGFNFQYAVFSRGGSGSASSGGWQAGTSGNIGTRTITVPPESNGAIVYWFTSSAMSTANTGFWSGDRLYTTGGQVEEFLDVSAPASYDDGLALGIPMTHNIATRDNQTNQRSETPVVKIGKISYPIGTTSITFTRRIGTSLWKGANWYYGASRVILVPELDKNGQTLRNPSLDERILELFGQTPYDDISDSQYHPRPPVTDEELLKWNADELRLNIADSMKIVDKLIVHQYSSGPDHDTLMDLREQLYNLRFHSGTIDIVEDAYATIQQQIATFNDYKFPFEP